MGAKLARDAGTSVPQRPSYLHRGQALLPQGLVSGPADLSGPHQTVFTQAEHVGSILQVEGHTTTQGYL